MAGTFAVVLCDGMASDLVMLVVDLVAFLGTAEGAQEFVWIVWVRFILGHVEEDFLDFVFLDWAELGRVVGVVVVLGWMRIGLEFLVVQLAE